MLGRLLKNEKAALAILKQCKEMGYEAIELNDFMTEPNPWIVKLLTSFADMPVGNSDRLNRHQLIQQSELEVCALHYDLGSLLKKTDRAMERPNPINVIIWQSLLLMAMTTASFPQLKPCVNSLMNWQIH